MGNNDINKGNNKLINFLKNKKNIAIIILSFLLFCVIGSKSTPVNETQYTTQINDLNNQIAILQEQKNELENEKNALQEQKIQLENENNKLQEDKTNLESEKQELN